MILMTFRISSRRRNPAPLNLAWFSSQNIKNEAARSFLRADFVECRASCTACLTQIYSAPSPVITTRIVRNRILMSFHTQQF